ncbi:MAG: ABC transporter ATP-binding protein [Bdellovibrionales bacterium]|nr:ABC transporter ATP-binding protein [Bdellovibrionales bacterium]
MRQDSKHNHSNAISEEPEKPASKPQSQGLSSIIQLLSYSSPYTGTLLLAFLALIFASGVNLAIPELIRRMLNSHTLLAISNQPMLVFGTLATVFTLQALAFYFRSSLFGIVGNSVVYDLRAKLYESLLHKSLPFFDVQRTGDLISRLNADTMMVQDAVSLRLSVCLRYTLQVLGGIGLMLYLSSYLTLAIVLTVPVLVLLAKGLGSRLRRISREQQKQLGESATIAEESLGGIRTVKAFNREHFEREKFVQKASEVKALGITRAKFSGFFASFVNWLMNLALIMVFLLGLYEVTHGRMSPGDLTAFLLYGAIVAISFAFLAGSVGELYQAAGAAERIFEVLQVPPEEDLPAQVNRTLPAIDTLTFQNISFSYPTRKGEAALSGISFTLERGRLTALVGPSGAGKSTIVNLLLRFYDATGGSIFANSIPITDFSRHAVRDRIGLVPQDPILFADSIATNIRYAAPSASDAELRYVAEQAAILDFIESLPQGFNTLVGERGIQLSGGQRQRLAIARALLKRPEILILDEATSSLDSEGESLIQQALSTLRQNCLVLAIAHRLSTIRNADEILVVHKGQIIQRGNHGSLMAEQGLYRDFVSYQELVAA